MDSWIDSERGFLCECDGRTRLEGIVGFGKRVDDVIAHGISVGLGRKGRQERQMGKN